MNDFVHLHVHSCYSLLDGACKIKELVSYVASLGQKSVAITDHGYMYGVVDFYNEAVEQGIKPIIGCEVYVAQRSRLDKIHQLDSKPYHLVLLCKDNEGYSNHVKIVSIASTEGFYNKPRTDIETLRKYSKGLIALSACLAGEIPRQLISGDYDGAKSTALLYRDIFGQDNFYLEIQNHKISEQLKILPQIKKISDDTGIPMVATNDVHYIKKTDALMQKILLSIQTGKQLDEDNPMAFPTDEFYLKSYEEMLKALPSFKSALDNTSIIADRCNVTFEFGKIKLPRFDSGKSIDNISYFKKLCYDGMAKRYGNNLSDEIKERMDYELSVITKMGYTDYYLIVWDFIKYARDNDIPVGPGRGSGAGSIAAYCIGITSVDPMKYGLLFERFLNPERVSMPDFDIDFCYEGRQRVIDYVVRKYGTDRVAQIITFGTMAAKGAVRDVGRVMGLPYQTVDSVSKLIPYDIHITLENALSVQPELKKLYETDNRIKSLIDNSIKIEGLPRHSSTHAAGVVISDKPVTDYVPVQLNDNSIETQYTMTVLEKLGLLKMDFLGLRNLTVIKECEDSIKKHSPSFDISKIPFDDKKVYDMISRGDTTSVFQLESTGMRRTLMKLKPENIEDIIAVISLYRPGPMDSIPKYIENRHNPDKIKYKHPLLKDILNVTYGCIVYQEQVMEICRKLGGYSYGRADLVRRAMAKKKADIMLKERDSFVAGSISNGVPEKTANEIFDEMISFASYAFNKSHAAAYSYVSYQTAYLRCHYYKEFMAATMTAALDNTGKLLENIAECEKFGVKLLTPNINESNKGFTAVADGIRFALLAVRNLGRSTISQIIEERNANGNFITLNDFCKRMKGKDLNKRALESLILSGAFDCFSLNRHQMTEYYDRIFSSLFSSERNNVEGQLDFFEKSNNTTQSEVSVPFIQEYDLNYMIEKEKEVTGIYISGHPLDNYFIYVCARKMTEISSLATDGEKVDILCTIKSVNFYQTKSNSKMAFVVVEDKSEQAECVIFPKLLFEYQALLTIGQIIEVSGSVNYRDEKIKIVADHINSAKQFVQDCCEMDICVRISSTNDTEIISNIVSLAEKFNGKSKLYFYFKNIGKKTVNKKINGINVCEELLRGLQKIAGITNVAFI